METPILYSARRCPFSTRARLALLYAGVQCELREINPAAKPPQLAKLSPRGTVPVLQFSNRNVLDDSLAIMHWALDDRDDLGLWPRTPVMQQSVTNLIKTVDGPFASASFRYRFHERFPERNQIDYRMEAEIFLAQMEARIARSGWLAGRQESLADLAVLPLVHGFAVVDRDWFVASPYAALRHWLQHYRENPHYQACLRPFAPWTEGAAPTYLLPDSSRAATA